MIYLLSALVGAVGIAAVIYFFSPFPFPVFDYKHALALYSRPPINAEKVKYLNRRVADVLTDSKWTLGNACVFVQTDPLEDLDDTVLFWLFLHVYKMLERSDCNIYFCLSGGLVNPATRLDYLKSVFPQLANVEFGLKYGSVTFLADAHFFAPEMPPIDFYLNCGPSSTAVKDFVATHLRGTAVFVGTNKDGSASDGINQRSTDKTGKLMPDQAYWNLFVKSVACFHVVNVEDSRHVLFPTFDALPETEWAKIPATYPKMAQNAWDTLRMFIVSRPGVGLPLPIRNRINASNSTFVAQTFYTLLSSVPPKHVSFRRGINFALAYSHYNRNVFIDSVLPVVTTCLFGGVYNGNFGFNPADKANASCLTKDSIPVFNAKMKLYANNFTPAYDLVALIQILDF
jgi:hypothetical protein